ncbi:MAG: GAF domain-containing protein [Spirulina sp. DLM2.Bin59]|nr:MAG: GAF domain-containing protein [Spirulina sp. DLM2.Bin59]
MAAFHRRQPSGLSDLASIPNDHLKLIEKLLSIGSALSIGQDLEELLAFILTKSREITYSDAGSVFLVQKPEGENPYLLFKVAQNDSLPHVQLREFAIPLTRHSLAGYVALTGRTLNIPDAQNILPGFPYQLDRNFDQDFEYQTCSVLVLPMQDNTGETIGVLQLINRKINPEVKITIENAVKVTQSYSEWEERVVRSLASQAAISIERKLLHENIENLFEGFVRASVQVIESRDPTTSGHSERVANLTVHLAEQVGNVSQGPLQLIYFTPPQIQEIRYAALLHDFGKVGVPEAILNKRKKLYPEQLMVIQQRFAVAQRTLERDCAEAKYAYLVNHASHIHQEGEDCSHCQYLKGLESQLERAIATLHRYQSLILEINEPEAISPKQFEAFSDEAWGELTALAEYRYPDVNGELQPLLTPQELEQLMLPMGNLTQMEWQAIKAHVTHSYEFLKQIPWTKSLQSVPIIAYGHHEKLNGSGYPRGLRGDEIPVQTQMMAIADIYDALTAADRPYKRPLPLEVALRILREEADKGSINGELVAVFMHQRIYEVLGHSLHAEGHDA